MGTSRPLRIIVTCILIQAEGFARAAHRALGLRVLNGSAYVADASRTGATCTHFPVAQYRGRRIADENARVRALRLARSDWLAPRFTPCFTPRRLAATDARVAVGACGGCLFGGGRRAGRSVPFTRWHADLAADTIDVHAFSPGHTRAAVAGWRGGGVGGGENE